MKRIILPLFFSFFIASMYSQVGIGTTNPDPSSILDINSPDKGLLIPRVNLSKTSLKSPINNPTQSLLVYNKATSNDVTPGFYYWDGSAWKPLTPAGGGGGTGSGWSLSGNNVSDSDFIGTLRDYKAFKFKVNGIYFGQFHPGGGISLGYANVNDSQRSISLGNSAEATQDAVAIGTNAKSISNESVAIGYGAKSNYKALAIGWQAQNNGNESVAIGNGAKSNYQNVAIGLNANAAANDAVVIGSNAKGEEQNTVVIGKNAKASKNNATALGFGAVAEQENTVILGNTTAKVGIGKSTTDPTSKLEINSTDKGLLIPRVALTNTNTIAPITGGTPTESLLVYNTNNAGNVTPGFYYWANSKWNPIAAASVGGSTDKVFGEWYYDNDVTIQLQQYTNLFPTVGVTNTTLTSNINTSGVNGFQIQHGMGGTYKITFTLTYSKVNENPNVKTVDFCLAKNSNIIPNTTITGDLNDDLKRRTLTMVKILKLDANQTYHFAIQKTGPSGGNITVPEIILHQNMSNMIIERLD